MSGEGGSPKELIEYFVEKFEKRSGAKMLVNWGRDMKLMKQVVAAYGPRTRSLIDLFFEDPDEWVLAKGFTVPLFYSQCNSLVSREGTRNLYESIVGPVSREDAQASPEQRQVPHIKLLKG